MKLPAPCMVGQENVLDFKGPRAKASGELRSSIDQLGAGINKMIAQRHTEQLRAAGLSIEESNRIEGEREKKIISGAIERLGGYISKSDVVDFLEDALATLGGK